MENITLKCEVQKLLAMIWLGNIISAIYGYFWLPTIEKEILWNPIPE